LASLAVGIVGAGVGFLVGGPGGAKLGWAVGTVLGGILFPPRLGFQGSGNDLKISGSQYGTPIPIVYGQMRVPGSIIWASDLVEVSSGGGKGGGKGKIPNQPSHTGSFAVGFCEGEAAGISRIWADDLLIYEDGVLVDGMGEITIYLGDETQVADPLIEADKGAGNVSGHRGLVYVVFEEMPLKKFGERRPNISAEIEGSELGYDSFLRTSLESVYLRRANGSLWLGGAPGGNVYSYPSITEVVSDFDIACGSKAASGTGLYIDETGQLWANGHNNAAAGAGISVFGNGITTNTHTSAAWVDTHGGNDLPNVGTGNLDFASILYRVYLVKSDNTLWFWGDGGSALFPAYSNRGDGSTSASSTPVQVGSDTLQVAVGSGGVLRLKTDGSVQYTGQGGGWAGVGAATYATSWTNSDIDDVTKIASNQSTGGGQHVSYAVKSDGTLWACGSNHNNGLGSIALGSGDVLTWQQIDVDGEIVTDIRGAAFGACCLTSGGNVWAWGEAETAGQGVTGATQRDPAIVLSNCRAIGNTQDSLFAITDTDDVYAWGDGSGNQRGDNSTTDLSSPTLMPWSATRQGVTVETILDDVSERVGIGAGDRDFSACSDSQVTGYILANRDEARNLIDPLIRCHFVDMYEVDGSVTGIIRGLATNATIDEDDMQCHETGTEMPPFLEHTRGSESELPLRIDLTYFSTLRDYDQVTAQATRVTNPSAVDSVTVHYHGTLSQTNGRHISETLLYEQWVQRDQFNTQLGSKYFKLVPSDRPTVPITPGGSTISTKIVKSDYSVFGLHQFGLVKYDPNIYSQVVEGATIEPTNTTLFENQPSHIFAFCAPAIEDSVALDNDFGVYCAVTAPTGRWDGGIVSMEPTELIVESVTERATCGLTTTVLGAPSVDSTAVWDTTSTVTVNLVWGSLESCARIDVLNGSNRAYIGGANDGEYIGFSTVTSLGGNVYQLSDLLRGQRGTDMNWGDHSVGDQFVLLDDRVFRVIPPYAGTNQWYGRDLTLNVNGGILISPEDSIIVTVDGSEFKPYSVCSVVAERDGGNDITLTWLRRTRAGGQWTDFIDSPLSEFDERYRVDMYNPAGDTIMRTSNVTAETATYSAANQTTDGYTPGDPVNIKITQIGKWNSAMDIDGFSEILTV
jgi:hypothetical protein